MPSTDDKHRIPRILAIATVTQIGNGQRGLWVWPQLQGCTWRGITR